MINRLFQLTCVLLLAILILRIVGKSEKPAVEWVSNRVQGGIAKTSGKVAHQPESLPVATSSPPNTPAAHHLQCPTGTQKTDSIFLGESLALQFKKQSKQFGSIAAIETQLGQPNCKGTNKVIWMTSDGKTIVATQQGSNVKVSFSF